MASLSDDLFTAIRGQIKAPLPTREKLGLERYRFRLHRHAAAHVSVCLQLAQFQLQTGCPRARRCDALPCRKIDVMVARRPEQIALGPVGRMKVFNSNTNELHQRRCVGGTGEGES